MEGILGRATVRFLATRRACCQHQLSFLFGYISAPYWPINAKSEYRVSISELRFRFRISL